MKRFIKVKTKHSGEGIYPYEAFTVYIPLQQAERLKIILSSLKMPISKFFKKAAYLYVDYLINSDTRIDLNAANTFLDLRNSKSERENKKS